MGRHRSRRGGEESCAARKICVNVFSISRIETVAVLAVILLAVLVGCSSRDPAKATSDPLAKVRLGKLIRFYQMYTTEKKKPPPNEQAFKDFIKDLPPPEKEAAGVGEDVDSFLVSPNDGQKYHIQYGKPASGAGPNRAFAWEETGKDGQRYVALTMGYVVQCDEERFQEYKKKK
jgi:hypothetical protein